MAICKFYQQGNCRFGDKCRFEHPGNRTQTTQNRYGPLQSSELGSNRNGDDDKWKINVQDVRSDLTAGKGRPNWILSAYGPGKAPPASLLKELEFSPEELRVEFYEQAALGRQDAADQKAIQTWNSAGYAIKAASDNAHNVPKEMIGAESKRPNRDEMCDMNGNETVEEFIKAFQPTSPLFSSNNNAASGFGQQSNTSTPFGSGMFGQPAFGQSGFGGAQQTTSTFGQPSGTPAFGAGMFGQPSTSNPGFGQPAFGSAGFGQEKKNPFAPASASGGFGESGSAFGQPSQPTSTFGQPSQVASAFGQPPQPSNFGQPSQPSTFGQPSQPSTFGQTSQPSSTFGQPTQPSSTFGQPAQPSAFGQPSQPSAYNNPFAKPSQPTSAFGQPSQLSSGFGQPAFGSSTPPATGSGAFGSGTFGDGGATNNPFGVKIASSTNKDQEMDAMSRPSSSRENPFGRPTNDPSPFGAPRPADAPRAGSVTTDTLTPHATSSSTAHPLTNVSAGALTYTQTLPDVPPHKDSSGRLRRFRGQKVTYVKEPPEIDQHGREKPATFYPCYERPDNKALEKIWFPEGGSEDQVMHLNKADMKKDLEAQDEMYTDEIKGQYKYLHQYGKFKDGKMPSVPPMRDWIRYDF